MASENLTGKSILDLEYINDTLQLNLVDFRISRLEGNRKKLQIYVIADLPDKIGKGHKFFIHFYPEFSRESEGKFLPLGTDQLEMRGRLLVFGKEFEINDNYFELIRYGLLDQNGKRLFTLTLDSVNLD